MTGRMVRNLTGSARRTWAWLRRVVRTGLHLARNRELPLWLRILFVIGCIQIPVLPFDEIALVLAVGITAVFYRPALRAAWTRA
jgi:hydrogenase/urease accessory protein HupE